MVGNLLNFPNKQPRSGLGETHFSLIPADPGPERFRGSGTLLAQHGPGSGRRCWASVIGDARLSL